jgi:hypothetical protein
LAPGSEGPLFALAEGDWSDEDEPTLIGLVHLACSVVDGNDLLLNDGTFGRTCPWCDDLCHVEGGRRVLDAVASICRTRNAPIGVLGGPTVSLQSTSTFDAFLDGMTAGAKIASLGWAVGHFRGDD